MITRASGGRWRFDLKLEATEPEVRMTAFARKDGHESHDRGTNECK